MTGGQGRALVLTLAVLVLVYAAMWWGWRRRGRRQADLPPLPEPPAERGPLVLGPVDGTYVGTTTARDWLDRVVVHSLGRRSPAVVTVAGAGVGIERGPEPPLFLPARALVDARLDRAHAGRVVEEGGLVVLTWKHGDRVLDTGVRPRRAEDGPRLRDAVTGLLAGERPA